MKTTEGAATQGTFDFRDPSEGEPDAGSIDERFAAFHAACPEVYALFVRYARQVRRSGRERYSADAILHRVRWSIEFEEKRGDGGFKINNNFTSRYARKLMEEHPAEFGGFFETRKVRTG